MNVAFVCTGEFEPWIYDFISRELEANGHRTYYAAFNLNARSAVKSINRPCYPDKLIRASYKNRQDPESSLFNRGELDEIMKYDYLRLQKNGSNQIKNRLKARAFYYEKFFRDFYRKHNIEAVVVWNYFPMMVHVAWRIARKMDLKTVFFENGPLRHTLMIDNKGVNHQGSLTGNTRGFYQQITVDTQIWKDYFTLYKKPLEFPEMKNKGIMSLFEKLYYALLMRNCFYRKMQPDLTADGIGRSIYKKLYTKYVLKEESCALPEKFVFIPLQCFSDTQVLINSPYINSIESFVRITYQAIKKALPDEYKIIVKEHPDDWGRINYHELKKQYPDIIWLKKYNIRSLIKQADLVITINSSVGIEALMYHKPVVTVGNSFYNIEGIVHHAAMPGDVEAAIKNALDKSVNTELIDKFLYYLRFKYLVKGSPRYFDEEGVGQMCKRVMELLGE
ncbi:MAG: CDP-glycerol glycerophosphotransferase family protein [Candidatus Omnitrophica bacterium]|nr:CDP-glycerol glycerophosphotransferase family protein [Candidatus Omnitrophota bacterium]